MVKNRGETRERIVAVAGRLFSQHGFEGVALSTIIAESDTSKGTLYHYFASKEDLYSTVLEAMLERVWAVTYDVAWIREASADNFWCRVRQGSRRSAEYMMEHPSDLRLWRGFQEQWRVLGDAGPTRRLRGRSLEMGTTLATLGQRLGVVRRDLTPRQCAELVEAVDTVANGWFFELADAHGEPHALLRHGDATIDFIYRLLSPNDISRPWLDADSDSASDSEEK